MERVSNFTFKRIADPVHATIGISELETKLLATQAVQRLRNINQLGLAHYVFPGADYSRLAHSIGACHVMGRIFQTLQVFSEIPDDIVQLHRLAALLHDIGHYPFSHTMEEAVKNQYSNQFLSSSPNSDEQQTPSGNMSSDFVNHYDHETQGTRILELDAEISEILKSAGIDPQNIYDLFARTGDSKFANLISSDLDADRLDYLLRTAHHTGLPYGNIDIEYLLSQIRIDSNNEIALTKKALRAAEHFLLCRYFDYQQVSFHKTVVAFEIALKEVLSFLIEQDRLDCSDKAIDKMISDGTWATFDDAHIIHVVREALRDGVNEPTRLKLESIITRNPARLVFSTDRIGTRGDSTELDRHKLLRKNLEEQKTIWANDFGIQPELWYIWEKPGFTLTKIGSNVPTTSVFKNTYEEDSLVQAIRIITNEDAGESKPLMELRDSIVGTLSNSALYSLRLYVLVPQERKHIIHDIRTKINASIRDLLK